MAVSLGYKDTVNALKSHVDEEDKRVWRITTPSGEQTVIIINESGLYSLALSSKLPDAKKFRHWITSEVLPSIRKTGGYVMGQSNAITNDALAQLIAAQQEFNRNQQEFNRLILSKMENLAEREAHDLYSKPGNGNPIFLSPHVAKGNLRVLNRKARKICELYGLEWNRNLSFFYKTLENRLEISLDSYLDVYRVESGIDDASIMRVLAAHPYLNEMANELLDFAIQRKEIYG